MDMQFYVDDARIEFALQIVCHELNVEHSNILRDMEQVFKKHNDNASIQNTEVTKTATASTVVIGSSSRSPHNPKFDSKRDKAKNMISSFLANQTRQA